MTEDTAREVIKLSLQEYHGNKFDRTIDNFNIIRWDFRGKICFYQEDPVKIYPNNKSWSDKYVLLMSIEEGNIIKLNPNLIRERRYVLETGKRFTGMEENKGDYDLDCTREGMDNFKYNKNLGSVLGKIRETRIDKILE